jgi:hypothetical protein
MWDAGRAGPGRLMSRRGLGIQAALLATLALVACGGEEASDASDGISVSDVEDAGLDFARCMRERGIDVPDPQPGVGGLRAMFTDGDRRNDPRFREAESECRRHLQDLVSQIDEDERRDFQEARLEFARCMREKGFDVPDPRSGPPSGGAGQGGALGDLDLNDPRVQEAMEACSERGPGLRLAE